MKNYKELLNELPSKSVVFTAGSYNPPSIGHELIIKVVRKLANQRKADHFIFVSSIQDAKKNPLEISKKMQYLGTLFPNTRFIQKELEAAVKTLKRYKTITMVVPADSVEYYKKLLKKFGITDVEFIKAGVKCPDEDDKLLKLASKGDFNNFKNLLPTTSRELDGKRMMNDVRIGLNLEPIKEQINLVKDDLREKYFRGEIFNEGDVVESSDTVYKIVKRGSNHLLLQDETGLKVSKWIQDVQLTEREFMFKETVADTSKVKFDLGAERERKIAELKANQAKAKEDLQKRQDQESQTLRQNLQTQQNESTDSPVVNTKSKYNIAKSVMSLSDFRKSMAQAKPEGNEEEKEIAKKVEDGLIGNSHLGDVHHLRHMKIKHHLGEGTEQLDELSSDTLQRYKDKAMKSSDELAAKGEYKKSNDRLLNHMKATGKQIEKTTAGIKAALNKEETEEQQDTRKSQLKRFKDQAAGAKLTEAQYAGLEKEDKPGKVKTAVVKTHPKAVEVETVEGWKDEKKPVKEEFEDINEDELVLQVEADLDALTEEDFYEAYEDSELAIIDEDTGEEIEAVAEEAEFDTPMIMEVLSRIERIRAKARMRRSAAKRQRREKIALRQLSTPEVANRRARRMAISALKKRLLRGQNPQKVSVGQKERMERFIQQRRKIVDRLATRMVSRVKQVEKARMAHKKFTKPNNGVSF